MIEEIITKDLMFALLPFAYGNHTLLFNMMMYLALAQGINVLYGFTGYLPFGYMGLFGAGTYGASLAVLFLHVPAPIAVLLGGPTTGALVPGVCVDIPLGTAFQYRCTGDMPLVFTCTAMPPWPGDDEALLVDGPWTPSVNVEPPGASS